MSAEEAVSIFCPLLVYIIEPNLFSPRSLPNPDCLKPPNGAATSVLLYVLTNTVPAWSFSLTYRALLMSLVNTPDAKPYSVSLARFRTPSMSLKIRTHRQLDVWWSCITKGQKAYSVSNQKSALISMPIPSHKT